MAERKVRKVIDEHCEVNPYDILETSLDEAIAKLQTLRRMYGGDAYTSYDIGDSFGDYYVDVTLHWHREETDSEYDKRIQQALKRSESAKLSAAKKKVTLAKEERILYERLKEKYENGTT